MSTASSDRTPNTNHAPLNLRQQHRDHAAAEGRDVTVKPEPVVTIVPDADTSQDGEPHPLKSEEG